MPRRKTSKKKTHRRRRRGGFMGYLSSLLGVPSDTMSAPAPMPAPMSPPMSAPMSAPPTPTSLGGKSRRRRR